MAIKFNRRMESSWRKKQTANLEMYTEFGKIIYFGI